MKAEKEYRRIIIKKTKRTSTAPLYLTKLPVGPTLHWIGDDIAGTLFLLSRKFRCTIELRMSFPEIKQFGSGDFLTEAVPCSQGIFWCNFKQRKIRNQLTASG